MPKIIRINHVAVVVGDMEKALAFWRDALGLKMTAPGDIPAESAQVAFLPLEGSTIELVKPTSEDSGLAKHLAKRGAGMHHVCLEVDDLAAMMARLEERGVRLINETPKTSADGRRYAFIHPDSTSGVLVELYER